MIVPSDSLQQHLVTAKLASGTGFLPPIAALSLERDFCRRRLARQKGPEGDVSAQRPEIADYLAREMAAKATVLLASCQSRVSEDWVVVGAVSCEPVSGANSLKSGNLLGKLINFSPSMALAAPICSVSQPASCASRFAQNREFPSGEQRILGALSWPCGHGPSSAVHACKSREPLYRKLKPGRNDGEARRGSGVNEWFRSVESDEKSAHPCATTDAF